MTLLSVAAFGAIVIIVFFGALAVYANWWPVSAARARKASRMADFLGAAAVVFLFAIGLSWRLFF